MFRIQGYLDGRSFSQIIDAKNESQAKSVLTGMILGLKMAQKNDWQLDLVRNAVVIAIEYPGKAA